MTDWFQEGFTIETAVPLFCVSDLHLGDRGPRDNFAVGGREQRFLQFLAYVKANQGKLLILGDLFDWWQVGIARSVNSYHDLLGRLFDLGAMWIEGNHDGTLGGGVEVCMNVPHPKIVCPLFREIGDRKFFFCHGHEGDPYCNAPNPGLGEISAILSAMAMDRNQGPTLGGVSVEDAVVGPLEAGISVWNRLRGREPRLEEMIDAVESERKRAGADVVVYGHTHAAGRIGDWHYNAGCWCRDLDTYVRIDDDGFCNLLQWTDDGPSPLDHELRAA
jgi:UDP-2,3-diacylglucosamine pyrophosphatase LpxH